MFLTFYGEARGNKHTHDHAHESPMTMLVPLGVLAVGAVFSGVSGTTASSARPTGRDVLRCRIRGHDGGEGGHGEDAAHGEEAHGPIPMARRAMAPTPGRGGCGRPRVDHHYVFTSPPGEGAIHAAPDNDVLNEAHYVPLWVKFSPFVAMILGFVTAYWFYILNPSIPGASRRASGRSTTSC
jgi:NADH-quinone oxidoreductase subunit L